MQSLTVVVPSRGRPNNIARLLRAVAETAAANTMIHVIVDVDDPAADDYVMLPEAPYWELTIQSGHRGLGAILNAYAVREAHYASVVGFMGDDHLPRTNGWDRRILEALDDAPGVAYGDDRIQGEALPTAAFISAPLIRALGHFSPPGLTHMYLDNFWMHLGRATQLVYLPDVVIEHLHPLAGTAPMDAGYERANTNYGTDGAAWNAYLADQWARDLDRLRAEGLVK